MSRNHIIEVPARAEASTLRTVAADSGELSALAARNFDLVNLTSEGDVDLAGSRPPTRNAWSLSLAVTC